MENRTQSEFKKKGRETQENVDKKKYILPTYPARDTLNHFPLQDEIFEIKIKKLAVVVLGFLANAEFMSLCYFVADGNGMYIWVIDQA